MPTHKEHRIKYQESREILNNLFDSTRTEHCNWITTICFYKALHIIEYEFATESINCKDHSEREEKMKESKLFNTKIINMYKQMGSNSRIARYKAGNITPTIANQMLNFLHIIEKEYDFPKNIS